MEKIRARVDEKGRIIIPAHVRKKLQIEPWARVDVRIERVYPRESFLEMADEIRNSFKKKKNAVKLLHEESPLR